MSALICNVPEFLSFYVCDCGFWHDDRCNIKKKITNRAVMYLFFDKIWHETMNEFMFCCMFRCAHIVSAKHSNRCHVFSDAISAARIT